MKCSECNTDMILLEETETTKTHYCPSCGNTNLRIDGSINYGIGDPNKKLKVKKPKTSFKQKITKLLLWLLWKVADDVTWSTNSLKEIYNDPPKDLENIIVHETYIYQYPYSKRKEILEWLDEED